MPPAGDDVRPTKSLIWDWPLRIWHWAFATVVVFSLATGLIGDIGLLEWHIRSGTLALGLLVFRIGWAVWGGLYARLANYRTSPSAILNHFFGRNPPGRNPPGKNPPGKNPHGRNPPAPHTAPGIALVGLLLAIVTLQVGTGLFATDEIFTEGPLRQWVSLEFARNATFIHNRAHWLIVALVSTHVAAHIVYGVLRDPTPLAMFTGKKPIDVPPTPHYAWRAAATLLGSALLVMALPD